MKMKKLKEMLLEQIDREDEFLQNQEVGSEEYNKSLVRLNNLRDKMFELQKERNTNIIEGVKVASSIALPIIGLVAITAFERGDTFTTSLKGFVNCFIPKKL